MSEYINKEKFKQEDIDRYENIYNQLKDDVSFISTKDLIELEYIDKEVEHIKIPTKLFSWILISRRGDLQKYCPFKVKVKKFERGNSYWRKYSNYMGLYDSCKLELFLEPNAEHSIVSLLWVLLHEFRHNVQEFNTNVRTNVRNSNLDNWVKYNNKDMEKLFHVFHEILPFEIDANTFACEMLEIDYPGSKFEITEETLKMLNE